MSNRIFVKPKNRERFKEIEQIIRDHGWEVTRKSVTDRHNEGDEQYLETTLILKQPLEIDAEK